MQENVCSWRQARENACEQITVGFAFLIGRKKWREIFNQSQSTVK